MPELHVQPYDWVGSDSDGDFQARIWTLDKESNRVLIRVEDYQPFCRLELPTFIEGVRVVWALEALKVYTKWLREVLEDHAPTRIVYTELERVYGFRERIKSPFLTCYFRSEEALRHCTNMINKKPYQIYQLGFIKARIWETNILPIHRLVTDLKVGYGQWLRVQAEEINPLDKISSNPREYRARFTDISGMTPEETKGWITSPLAGAVDIECYSSNHKAMPNKFYVQDCIFMISYITQKLGDPKSKKKYLLVLGDCPDIPGATIRRFNNEIAMVDGLADLITETDPSLLVGYNTYKFDYPYLDARIKAYLRDWKNCGLIKQAKTYVNTKTWKSSAYGFMNISTLEAEGRLSIDMFPIIKRDHKLDRYTLDSVANHFLKRGKHDVSAAQMFRVYQAYMNSVPIIEKVLPENYFVQDLPRYPLSEDLLSWLGKQSEIVQKHLKDLLPLIPDVSPDSGITQGQLGPDELDALKGYAQILEDLRIIGDYNLEDSVLCIDLMDKLKTWIALIETSSVVAVTVMSIFTRGQQIRVQNQVYQYAYRDGFVLDEQSGNSGKFTGAYVVDPIPGKYRNVLIFDFASLYPNIIRAFNICYTTLVPDESPIPDEMCHILAWEETDDKGVITKHRYRFIKQDHFLGILPRMCEHLISSRKAVRSQIGPQNDNVTNIVLEQRQGALKISANSIFGSLGVREGRMPLPAGAASITAMGRYLSGKAGDHVTEKHNGKVVYGDTDSIMIDLGIVDPHQCKIIGEALSEEISNLFPKPLKMEFERALAMALFIKKKKYAGVMMTTIEKNDNPKRGPLVSVQSVNQIQFGSKYDNPELALWRIEYTETIYGKVNLETALIGVPKGISLTLDQPYYSGIPLALEDQDIEDGWVDIQQGAPDQKKILKKGVVLARRDNCIWLKETYLATILNILFDKPLEETREIIDREVLRMMSRSVPFLKMSVTREIGSNYKPNSNYPLKIFSDELKRMSHPIQGGDRIDYVFVKDADEFRNSKQGYKMRLHEHFWQNYSNEPLDTLHYVEKILKNPIDQIFYLGYKTQIDAIQTKCNPEVKRRGKVYTYMNSKYLETWVKMIKLKQDLTETIKTYHPHFTSMDPWFSSQWITPQLIVMEPEYFHQYGLLV